MKINEEKEAVMKNRFKGFAVIALALFASACANVGNEAKSNNPDFAIAPGNKAVIFGSAFGDPIGSIATIDADDPTQVEKGVTTTDGSDAVIRSFGGRIYVINRFGTDTIQVLEPPSFSVAADFSVGAGSNPQDIVVLSEEKAYVSRLDSQNDAANTDDVLIVNPMTGEELGSIDLKPYTADDGDRLARAAQMVLVDGRLYVCMQDLPGDMWQPADTNGKVAVIDTEKDEVVDVVELAGMNPSDITYSAPLDEFFVASTGKRVNFVVDTSDATGGIEAFHRAGDGYESDGIVIDDAEFGGDVAEVRLASDALGFTIVNSGTVASFNPTERTVVSKEIYTSPFRWLPDVTLDGNGMLWIAEQDFAAPGIVIIDPADGSVVAGPIEVGPPPVSITFVDVE